MIFILLPESTEPIPYPVANDEDWAASLAEQWTTVNYFFAS